MNSTSRTSSLPRWCTRTDRKGCRGEHVPCATIAALNLLPRPRCIHMRSANLLMILHAGHNIARCDHESGRSNGLLHHRLSVSEDAPRCRTVRVMLLCVRGCNSAWSYLTHKGYYRRSEIFFVVICPTFGAGAFGSSLRPMTVSYCSVHYALVVAAKRARLMSLLRLGSGMEMHTDSRSSAPGVLWAHQQSSIHYIPE